MQKRAFRLQGNDIGFAVRYKEYEIINIRMCIRHYFLFLLNVLQRC